MHRIAIIVILVIIAMLTFCLFQNVTCTLVYVKEARVYEVDVHNLVFNFKRTPAFERCIIGCEFKNECQKDLSWKEIEKHAQILLTILDSTMNI